jgi:hypothetical protein
MQVRHNYGRYAAAANATTTNARTVPATTDVRLANRYAASLCSWHGRSRRPEAKGNP